MIKIWEIIGKAVFFVYAILANGFVFSKLWAWFFVPVFSLPILTVMQSIGIVFSARVLLVNVDSKKDERTKEEKDKEFIIKPLIVPPIVLFIGWIIKLFL